jgi:protein-S-isoprenylcysteine O-methyltransferase Ste14
VAISPVSAANLLFVAWAVSWILAAVWSSRTQSRAGVAEQLPYRFITIAGFFLLFGVRPGRSDGYLVFWTLPDWASWIMTGLTGVGFAFAWWARLHLGKLWSAFVTRKTEHRIVDTGPYGIVRHPIYSGIILAAVAVAILKANLYAIIGALLIIIGFWIKARLEERFLSQQLGPETYAAYRHRVPMLFPKLPSSSRF